MRRILSTMSAVIWIAEALRAGQLAVPQAYPTIQAAIDAASASDTVLVSEGRYTENIDFRGKGIVVASRYWITQDPATILATVIDGSRFADQDSASTVRMLNGEPSTAVLDGFTITGGAGTRYVFANLGGAAYQEGAAIIISRGSPVVRNNVIVGNEIRPRAGGAQAGGGGGIAAMFGHPQILNNLIVSNKAGYAGGIVLNWSGGVIRNNLICHNVGGTSGGGGGIMAWYPPADSAQIENNTIVGNFSQKDGGGIVNTGTSGKMIRNNVIWLNRQASGGQVTGPQSCAWNDIEDFGDAENISVDPALEEGTFALRDGSPCIDAGDPAAAAEDTEDPGLPGTARPPSRGGVRNDMGVFGGPFARNLATVEYSDLCVGKMSLSMVVMAGLEGTAKVELVNFSTGPIRLDSVTVGNPGLFETSIKGGAGTMAFLGTDTLLVRYRPVSAGTYTDTVKIHHNATGVASPIRVSIRLRVTPGSAVDGTRSAPQGFRLFQNDPNPFNPSTRIRFSLGRRSHVRLNVFDTRGRWIDTLADGVMESGPQQMTWRPEPHVSSGLYLLRLEAGGFSDTVKMSYVR